MYRITKKYPLNNTTEFMSVEAPLIAEKAKPGQFIILRIDEVGERIPLTISSTNTETGEVSVVFQRVGATTERLAALSEGDYLLNFVGPLGKPTPLEGYKNVAVIGGGLGCAIALPQAVYLHKKGVRVEIIAGFRTKELVILEDEMKSSCDELILMTDDGTYGERGLVTAALERRINEGAGYDLVLAIGPAIMMKFVSLTTKKYGIKTIVSLNPIMIDGTGMCGSCRVTVGGKVKFACVDGPDFDGHEVDFDELIRRNAAYRAQEAVKLREWNCNLLKMKPGKDN
jgi:ferredoxin--NADP+ reductase